MTHAVICAGVDGVVVRTPPPVGEAWGAGGGWGQDVAIRHRLPRRRRFVSDGHVGIHGKETIANSEGGITSRPPSPGFIGSFSNRMHLFADPGHAGTFEV